MEKINVKNMNGVVVHSTATLEAAACWGRNYLPDGFTVQKTRDGENVIEYRDIDL